MAWHPPETDPALAAVALRPETLKAASLTRAEYRQHLSDRVAWMVGQADDPEAAVRALQAEMEARGLWPVGLALEAETPAGQVQELLADNPAWPDYLNLVIDLPAQALMSLRQMPAAISAVRETTIEEWMSLAFLPIGDLR